MYIVRARTHTAVTRVEGWRVVRSGRRLLFSRWKIFFLSLLSFPVFPRSSCFLFPNFPLRVLFFGFFGTRMRISIWFVLLSVISEHSLSDAIGVTWFDS